MKISKAKTITLKGLKATDVDVEVHMANGLPAFVIVGLADKAVSESKERVRAALSSIGLSLPPKKITINLSPADIAKEGSHFDLPIALGLLGCLDIIPEDYLNEYIIAGELSLDGAINQVAGILPMSMHAYSQGLGIICPSKNGKEAIWSGNIKVLAPSHITEFIQHAKGDIHLNFPEADLKEDDEYKENIDMRDIKGQVVAKRVLEVAAAGGHNLLMYGPPGTGKSMLAKRMNTILPPLTSKEVLETSMISSVAGLIDDGKLITKRPFRAPHHSSSIAAMVGGGFGNKVKPGEISLSHNGVLFLDELPEFNRAVLDSLRQPLETRQVLIARSQSHVTYPANFQLVAAMNPCPCGYLSDADRSCSKAPRCSEDYLRKISGPIMDRFDLFVEVTNVDYASMKSDSEVGESSRDIIKRVIEAREVQNDRYKDDNIKNNSDLHGDLMDKYAKLEQDAEDLLLEYSNKLKLSMRAFARIVKVARTVQDIKGDYKFFIKKESIAEALNYRLAAKL